MLAEFLKTWSSLLEVRHRKDGFANCGDAARPA
jgi:hypothetical protein